MNNSNEFSNNNIFESEDILSKGSTPLLVDENSELNLENSEGAYVDSLIRESSNLTPLKAESEAANSTDSADVDTISGAKANFSSTIANVNYAVIAGGQLTVSSQGDFDGDPLILQDDANIYAADGFDFRSNQAFPILRDSSGKPILDENGKQQLLENAVVVSDTYSKANISVNNYIGLIPPQIGERPNQELTDYADLVTTELDNRVTEGVEPVIFDAKKNKINSVQDWNNKFPQGGTAEEPTYVKVTGGKLDIPSNLNLSNYVIVVEKGDISFKSSSNDLNNVLLQAENGKIDANGLNANNTALLASQNINIRGQTQFTGDNLIANAQGRVEFSSRVTTPSDTDNLSVFAADDLEFRSPSEVNGQLLTADDLIVRSQATFRGSLGAKGDITLNSPVSVYGTNKEIESPEITATIDSVTVDEGNEGDEVQLANVTVALSESSASAVSVDYATSDDTAIAGEDYQATRGTVSFNPSETTKTIEIPIVGDSIDEGDEAFEVQLSNPDGITLSEDTAVVSIIDDDEPPEIATGDVVVNEATSSTDFTVTLNNPSSRNVTVDFATADGAAVAGSDYQATSGTLTFEPGEVSKTVTVAVTEDNLDESDESFFLNLDNAANATINSPQAKATITDDDDAPLATIDGISVTEGDDGTTGAFFTVNLDNPSGQEISIDYATSDKTATAGTDYVAQTGTLTFEPSETSKTIEIAVVGDLEFEPEEAFEVSLSNPINVVIDEEFGTGTGTIADNDISPITLNLNLANDTGVDDTDNISHDATITGVIDNAQGDISLSASIAGGEPRDFNDLVQPDGSFTLGIEQLGQINGGDLGDGTYILNLTATDSQTGEVSQRELTFTLDTTAPSLNLTTPLADGDHSSKPRLIGEVAESALADLTYSLDGEAAKEVVVDEAGNFNSNLSNGALNTGNHAVEATATDIAGNQTSTEVSFQVGDIFLTPNGTKGWGAKNDSTLILGEQDSYVVETSVPVELGLEANEEGEKTGTRTINFDLKTAFDRMDAKAIEDQLLVYLIDPANPSQTLLDNGTEGSAVFSIAGEQSDFTPGLVSFDGKTVTIDASSLTDATEGLLVFQLLNQDEDIGSVVTVNNLTSTTDPSGFANPIFSKDNNPVAVGGALNLDNLTKASNVETIVNKVRFNAATGEYRASLSIKNNGAAAISRNSAVVFNNLPDGVELSSPSGVDSAGNPYVNLRPAIRPGGLNKGVVSESVEVVFTNPNLIRFGLDTTVLVGSPNAAPVFEPIGNLTVTPGEKLELPLAATDKDGDTITYKLKANGNLPTGKLDGNGILKFQPKPNEIGSYEFTVIATDGVKSVSQTVTLNVVADPITTTRISGVIKNVQQQSLAGVTIELGELKTVTNADGSFTIETNRPLTEDTLKVKGIDLKGDKVYPFIAEKLPLLLGQKVYAGFNNVIDRPIYLPALDVASGKVIDPSKDVTVTTENIPQASVFVEAGSLSTQSGEDFTGTLSITKVPNDLTPAALPENLSPDLVVTIQPGEMVFNTPAPLNLPNLSGYEPGMEMDLWSINPETGDFDNVGTGIVSDDGTTIETIDGGIRNSSWHFFAPPPPPVRPPGEERRNEDNKCPDCKASGSFNSEVEFHSGAVIETHDLTTYSSNGSERGVTLTYDSLRADPRPIVHFGYDNVTTFNAQQKLIADLSIEGNGFEYQVPGYEGGKYGLNGGEHFWSIPSNQSGDLSVGLQADMRELPSGLYDYTVNSGLYRFGNNVFTGSSNDSSGDFVHVNTIDSDFGSGWSIAGWQELVENSDGSVLLIDGDGGELLFEATEDGQEYVSPPGDFSTLEKLPDGTFKRTMKDRMVYEFNSANDLESVTDRNGNQTSYQYNADEQLTKIVDPVGLETVLAYNEAGLVSTITDPGDRTTQLEYDQAGNLTRITDPDGTIRSWSYDEDRLMVAETDQRGNQEQAFYDQYGRADRAILKDGSTVQVDPLQTQGLYSPEATINPLAAPNALIETQTPTATYIDSNGDVTVTEVDRAGQAIASFDEVGQLPITERNDNNLITNSTDGRGNETKFTYDEQGNVLTIEDSLTLANNAGGNALIINGAEASSEPELSLNTTNTIDSLLLDSGFETTIANDIPNNISEYEQVWDLRFDNSSAISEAQQEQYLNFLKTGGNLFVIGENSVFKERNNSVLNLIKNAGGGQLNSVLPSSSQQVLSPFDSPNPIADNITFRAPGGVLNAGTGQLIAVDNSDRGVGVAFTKGSLGNAAAGELTAIFDISFIEDADNNPDIQNLLDNLTQIENSSATQSYAYDPIFNQVTSYTDELGRLTLNDVDPNNGNILSTTRVVGSVGGEDDLITSYTYTDAGLVDTMTDPLGRIIDYEYDDTGRLIKETHAVGTIDEASIEYEYDGSGNQTVITDENGNQTKFAYDNKNRVTQITEADPDGSDGELTSPITTVTYDESGNLTETIDPLGNSTNFEYDELNRQTKVTDSLDRETTYEYDDAGNIIAMIDGNGRRTQNSYDSRDRLTETIDPLGNSTKYKYDLNNNLTAVTDPLGNTTRNFYDSRDRLFRTIDAEGNVTNYEYDGADNLIATVDANEHRTEYEYDELDRQVKQIDALGSESTIAYDKVGNVIATTDEESRTTELAYDHRDRNTSTTNAESGVASFEYDAVGNVIATTDEENRTTNFEYDALNRQTSITDPLAHVTSNSYDAFGNLISTADGNNNVTNYIYDQLNRLSVVTNPFGDNVTTSYDAVGNVTDITDELGRTTTFEYDERDLPTSITDPLGNTSTTQYDAVGNAIALTDPLGNKTTYAYDQLYRLIDQTDAENRTTTYNYDPLGNLLSLTDPEQNTTSYGYDELNRLITDTNQLGDTRTYEYDAVGNQISSVDRNGREINYQFDRLNRNTNEVWLDEAGNPVRTFDFEYDAASQLLNASDPDSAYSYEYDEDGRVTSINNAGTPGVPNVVFDYAYDPVDNLTEVTDSIDGVDKGVEEFTYDKLDRVTQITQSGDGVSDKRVDYTYDKASQMTGMSRYSDLTGNNLIAESNYTFDDAGRLTNLTHDSNGNVLSAYDWAYDNANRITQATSPDGVSDYNYDHSDQLVDAEHDYQTDENYVYDENGNRVNDGYVTGENNQLLSDGTYNYEYDNEGNRVKRTEIATGEATKYEWDYRNRLVAVETVDVDGNAIANSDYTYDVFDNRIGKSVDADGDGAGEAVVERFVYDGDHIALTFDGEGNQTERFLHGNQIDQVLAQENAGGEVLWALADNQGSVRMLLDNDGNVVNEISYDAFGNITLETNGNVNFRFSYTGRELDEETGLYNYRSRYYDPAVGQFINEDTIGFNGGDSNLYRYVGNNPLNYIDPFGFCGIGSSGNGKDKNKLSDLWDATKPARQFLDGFATQQLLNQTGGEVYIDLFDSKFNQEFSSASNQSLSLKLGRTAADVLSILQGAAEITGGKVLEGAGIALSVPSGLTSLIAVPAGVVLDVHGGVVAGSGIKDLTEIWREGNNSDNLSPQFYKSSNNNSVGNMNEFFGTDFGSSLSSSVGKTSKQFQGQSIYEVTKKPNNNILKKGDKLYLDNLHKNHLEVFDKKGNVKAVLNLDGTVNTSKTKTAIEQGRSIKKLL